MSGPEFAEGNGVKPPESKQHRKVTIGANAAFAAEASGYTSLSRRISPETILKEPVGEEAVQAANYLTEILTAHIQESTHIQDKQEGATRAGHAQWLGVKLMLDGNISQEQGVKVVDTYRKTKLGVGYMPFEEEFDYPKYKQKYGEKRIISE